MATGSYLTPTYSRSQKLLNFHNQELTIVELIGMHEQEQEDIEEFEFLHPVQSEDRMMVRTLTEGLG
ncbi:hypothetical protein TNCV_426121 [Trichonephila clavipes]|nr:hypothetical protein TNCV_426121 [Trichonephila clavipes]